VIAGREARLPLLVLVGLSGLACQGRGTPGPGLEEVPATAAPTATDCGHSGGPDCPLQAWMKATLQPYLLAGQGADTERLQAALEKLASVAPAGFPEWANMARDGAAQAAAGQLSGVRHSCTRCHDAYRARYRAELRGRTLL
jgi:hypothetical protein